MEKIAIDLTWVRHKKVGGTESYIRNLLFGFAGVENKEVKFVLMVARDNKDSFREYEQFECFELCECNVDSANQKKRVIWQNLKLGKVLKEKGIKKCFEPIYGVPFLNPNKIKYYTVIHDLQAMHYPEYFTKFRVLWMKLSWWNAVHVSEKVITISNYVKNDIVDKFRVKKDKIEVIYNAISVNLNEFQDEKFLEQYQVKSKEYYYTVSSLAPHKNLKTLICALGKMKEKKDGNFRPLIISGVGGDMQKELERLILEYELQGEVVLTGYIDNVQRNTLYKYCKVFIFPSIFEGFGMPPIEAMLFGVPVLTTNYTCLPEVTEGIATYVADALRPQAWRESLNQELVPASKESVTKLLQKYDKNKIAKEYIKIFE